MRDVFRMVAAVRFALSTRRDLLLESLALRHQLRILARSNRRFRPSDRLLWLLLRRWWPRWREALVLVQPATVDRWHREGFGRCWRRSSRRPGRPRIDSRCRDLIRRVATENCLWGAPRIHGELLKLGIAVSERTVSRYLRGRRTAPSQTWRTFFANHFGQLAFISPVASSYAVADPDVIDTSRLPFRPDPLTHDEAFASTQWASVDWPRSLRNTSPGLSITHGHLHDREGTRNSAGRDPPPYARAHARGTACGPRFVSSEPAAALRDRTDQRGTIRALDAGSPAASFSVQSRGQRRKAEAVCGWPAECTSAW